MNTTAPKHHGLVLVVDDERDYLNMIMSALTADRIPFVSAASIDRAIAILRSRPISITLTDWRFKERGSEQSGLEILRVCREVNRMMPVIVMSGQPFDMRTDAVAATADSFLQKPFSMSLLLSHLAWWQERVAKTPIALLPEHLDMVIPVNELKRIYIQWVVQLCNGVVSEAEDRLGLHRHTITKFLRKDVDTNPDE